VVPIPSNIGIGRCEKTSFDVKRVVSKVAQLENNTVTSVGGSFPSPQAGPVSL